MSDAECNFFWNLLQCPVMATPGSRERRDIACLHKLRRLNEGTPFGWQTTRDSQLGGGDVPATPIAPAFTIEGFSDISFDLQTGWAQRARAKYQITRRWSVEPCYIHWNVSASPVNYETETFTVNGITARQRLGFYEPLNTTNEFVVRLGFRF